MLLILGVGLFLRVTPLPTESVSGDELFSRRVAMAGFTQTLEMARADLVHPPLYYLVIKAPMAIFGSGLIGIRMLSLVSGLLTIIVVASYGFVLPPFRRSALLAAALLAVNDAHIFYSQEARSYAFYGLLVSLLMLWALLMERSARQRIYWVFGSVLMTTILYTHYVGALYIIAIIVSLWLTKVPKAWRLRAVAAAGVASLAFAPWLLSVMDIYGKKHGLGQNLSWQGYPTLYDLKATFATFSGIPALPGGTTISFLVGVGLISVVLLKFGKHQESSSLSELSVRILVSAAVLPPILLYVATLQPLHLPVYGLRHVLPSAVAWVLLTSAGCFRIGNVVRFRGSSVLVGVVLVGLQLSSTLAGYSEPRRYPFAVIADQLNKPLAMGCPAFATDVYGIGEPINFYLKRNGVRRLPQNVNRLPNELILIYRPRVARERARLEELIRGGWSVRSQQDWTDRHKSQYGPKLVVLAKSGVAGGACSIAASPAQPDVE